MTGAFHILRTETPVLNGSALWRSGSGASQRLMPKLRLASLERQRHPVRSAEFAAVLSNLVDRAGAGRVDGAQADRERVSISAARSYWSSPAASPGVPLTRTLYGGWPRRPAISRMRPRGTRRRGTDPETSVFEERVSGSCAARTRYACGNRACVRQVLAESLPTIGPKRSSAALGPGFRS